MPSYKVIVTPENKFTWKKTSEDGSSLGVGAERFDTAADAQAFIDTTFKKDEGLEKSEVESEENTTSSGQAGTPASTDQSSGSTDGDESEKKSQDGGGENSQAQASTSTESSDDNASGSENTDA